MFRLSHQVRNGIRLLGRPRGVAIAAVLSLGVGVNLAVFSVVHAVLVRPLPHPNPERLVSISSHDLREGRDHQMAPLDFFDFERQSSSFERLAAYYPPGFTLTGGTMAERLPGARVSSGIFEVLGVRPIHGRGFLAAEDMAGTDRVAVIAHSLWARRFESDPAIVGRAITLSGNPYTVIGVLPEGFDSPAMWPRMPEVWVPIGLDANVDSRDARMLRVLGRLRDGVPVERARADLERIAAGLGQTYPELANTGVTITPLLEQLTREVRPTLLMLIAGVVSLLLVSIGNAAGLILGGTLHRRHEFSTRLALGASRRRLVAQFVGEHVVLGAAGAVAGFAMAYFASDMLVEVAITAGVPRASEIHVGALALSAGILLSLTCAILCAAVAGVSVVRRAESWRMAADLRVAARPRPRTDAALLAIQTAFSLALLTGGILLTRSFYELAAVDPGFDAEQTYTLRLSPPAARYPAGPVLAGFYDRVAERVRALPGVSGVTVVDWLPASGAGAAVAFTIDGRSTERQLAELRVVGDTYFDTLSVPVVAGRPFDTRDRDTAPRVVMVNESFARAHFGAESPIGRQILFERGEPFTATIVGVTRDVREISRRVPPSPGVYAPKTWDPLESTCRHASLSIL